MEEQIKTPSSWALNLCVPFHAKAHGLPSARSLRGALNFLEPYVEGVERELALFHREWESVECSQEALLQPACLPQAATTSVFSISVAPLWLEMFEATHLQRLCKALLAHSPVAPTEWSVELRGQVLEPDKLRVLKEHGVNRVSLSAEDFKAKRQSPSNTRRNLMEEAVALIRSSGIEQVNIDLMFQTPNQRLKDWEEELEAALALKVEHLSTYEFCGQERFVSGEERLACGENWLVSGEERFVSGENRLACGQEWLVSGQKRFVSGENRLACGEKRFVSGEERLASGQKRLASGQERFVSGEERLASGQKRFVSGEERFVSGQERLVSGQKKSEEAEAAYFLLMYQMLKEKGWDSYEVAHHAWGKHRSQHLLNIWNMGAWRGIGPSAASQWQTWRFRNARWAKWLRAGKSQKPCLPHTPPLGSGRWQKLSRAVLANDALIFALRQSEGVCLKTWTQRFKTPLPEKLADFFQNLKAHGLAKQAEERLSLTNRGRLLADGIGAEILAVSSCENL